MVCSYCKKPIKDYYLSAGKKVYHKECYETHVAARCSQCGKTISGQFVVQAGKSYHRSCFERHVAIKCDICGDSIAGKYYKDFYGNHYHEAHKTNLTGCPYCGRPICETLTQGGRRYSDGRAICTLCHMTAVKTESQLQSAIKYTSQELQRLGLTLDWSAVYYEMVGVDKLRQVMGKKFSAGSQGAMSLTEESINGKVVRRDISISVLYGLPAIRFKCVLAHELTHVWFKLHCPALPPQVEEGTANLVSALIFEDIGNEEARFILHTMDKDDDPVYGVGYQKARRQYKKEGLIGLLANVCRKKAFSGGFFSSLWG